MSGKLAARQNDMTMKGGKIVRGFSGGADYPGQYGGVARGV
ncbi:hypothetical protein [Salmonella enterica]|nr:hypothetical protein [Salmonella enterica]